MSYFSKIYHYLIDPIKIVLQGPQFIFSELAERAFHSDKEFEITHLGLPFARFLSFAIVTSEPLVKAVASYGDPIHSPDEEARKGFQIFSDIFGAKTLLNTTDIIPKDRLVVKDALQDEKNLALACQTFSSLRKNWDDKKPVQESIFYSCAIILAKALFNLEEVPPALIPILNQLMELLLNPREHHSTRFNHLLANIHAFNPPLIAKHKEAMMQSENLCYALTKNQKSIDELNWASGLLAGEVPSHLLAGTLFNLLSSLPLKEKLKKEFRSLFFSEENPLAFYQSLKNLPLLDAIYQESLRFWNPAAGIGRFLSKPAVLANHRFPARTYIFVLPRLLAFKEEFFQNPAVFDPSRFLGKKRMIGKYPFIPFSQGPRSCPAGLNFMEMVFKVALYFLLKEGEKELNLSFPQSIHMPNLFNKRAKLHPYFAFSQAKTTQDVEPKKPISTSPVACPSSHARQEKSATNY